jgi:hypothetical protein
MRTSVISNSLRDIAISLYSSKIVDKKEILRTFSNKGKGKDIPVTGHGGP